MNTQIEVTLIFSGEREIRLTAKDAEYKELILLMFKHRQSWKTVEVSEDGMVRLMPDMPKGVE